MKMALLLSSGLALVIAPAAAAQVPSPANPREAALEQRVRTLEALVQRLEARLDTPTAVAAVPAPQTSLPTATAAATPATPSAPAVAGATAEPAPAVTLAARQVPGPAAPTDTQTGVTPAATGTRGDGFRVGSRTVKIGGYVKLNGVHSRYSAGNLASNSPLRSSLAPVAIPVGGAPSSETEFDARESRLWITTDGLVGGHKVGTRIEIDSAITPGDADNRTTNAYNINLRRAYVTFDKWLAGQEWTNFQDIRAFPESALFTGPAGGTILVRQGQLRYTSGPWSFSVENPETTYSSFNNAARVTTGDTTMPDIIARYDVTRPGGFLAVAAMVRQLRSDTPLLRDTTYGWGVSASGKVATVGKDDLRFQVTGGRGIGRYMLNFFNDGVLGPDGHLHAIPSLGGFAAYRHFWTPTLRSSVIVAGQHAWNDRSRSAATINNYTHDEHLNLVWSPFTGLDVGGEYIHAERVLENDAKGAVDRFITFVRFGF